MLIGLFAGLISFIPFIGAILGALIAVTVAIYQFWDMPIYIAYVSFIFLAGQILESNFLTPKLIGDAVRLHPLVIMLSISIGGAMAGLSGIMLAIPLAVVLILVSFSILFPPTYLLLITSIYQKKYNLEKV